jgi:hypothetical protein
MTDADTCHRGHLRTPAGTYVSPRGYKRCRACAREDQKKWIAAHPEANLTRHQVRFLKKVDSGLANRPGYNGGDRPSPQLIEALGRRGYIYRTAGTWQLTEAGQTALAALTPAGVS